MIAPRWDTFPEPTRSGYTSFYLRISDPKNERDLINEVTSFDLSLLLFLRRLNQLELSVTREDGTTWSERLQRKEQSINGQSITTLTSNAATSEYINWRHIVTDIPSDPKRTNVTRSEIVLAFPVPEPKTEPESSVHNVYAYLPIRDFGFNVSQDSIVGGTQSHQS